MTGRPLVEAWADRTPEGNLGATSTNPKWAGWVSDPGSTVVPLIAADRLTESSKLREVVRAAVLDNFHAPNDSHSTWWIDPDAAAVEVLAALRAHLEAS